MAETRDEQEFLTDGLSQVLPLLQEQEFRDAVRRGHELFMGELFGRAWRGS
jgi:hypothetical protein